MPDEDETIDPAKPDEEKPAKPSTGGRNYERKYVSHSELDAAVEGLKKLFSPLVSSHSEPEAPPADPPAVDLSIQIEKPPTPDIKYSGYGLLRKRVK